MNELTPFNPQSFEHLRAATELWNAACGPEFAITPAFVEYNTQPVPGYVQEGRIAWQSGRAVGFVLASAAPQSPEMALGCLDAIVAQPTREGTGAQLLAWAEAWLQAQGCQYVRLGGSIRPFTPGLPADSPTCLSSATFFTKNGFHQPPSPHDIDWDVARDLGNYQPDPPYAGSATFRLCQPGEEPALLEFLRREFPGRWQFEAEEYLRIGGRVSDIMLAWVAGRVEGFCWCTYADSQRPLERYYHHQLPQPWGQAGPLGVSQGVRGQKLGRAVVDAALAHMQSRGVRGCVIDWTALLDFYAIFGFEKYHHYLSLFKQLAGD